ncbi:MAG: 23S rRNA pseudouridine(1911/1915/1917) synthase RluD [Planctomycetota bacterium]
MTRRPRTRSHPAVREPATVLSSRVPRDQQGARLCDYLASRFRYRTRQEWLETCAAGEILLRDRPATGEEILRAGETVRFRYRDREPEVDARVLVVHADLDLVVAAKPAHLPCHADGPFRLHTFIQILRERLGDPRLSLVHRIDRETSGLLVVARTRRARKVLHESFREGRVRKTYLAVARGAPSWERMSCRASIGLDPDSRVAIRRRAFEGSPPGSAAARTDFRVIRRLADRAVLLCEPRSGRTHQIRAHLLHLGHPLLGDKLYGRTDDEYLAFVREAKRGTPPWRIEVHGAGRHMLHAQRIAFCHPRTGQPLCFEAPVPDDMAIHAGTAIPRDPERG